MYLVATVDMHTTENMIAYLITFRQTKSYSEHENPASLRRKRKRYECLETLLKQQFII